jgi:tyrosyl-tRNA synthetase
VRRELPEQIDEFAFSANGDGTVHLPALLAEAFGISRSEGRRMLAQAGVRLDGEPLDDSDLDLPAERLDGAVIQVGRRRFKRLRRL